MFEIEKFIEIFESLEGTAYFLESFEAEVTSTLLHYDVDYEDLSEEEQESIKEIIQPCECGLIKLTEYTCENCGG